MVSTMMGPRSLETGDRGDGPGRGDERTESQGEVRPLRVPGTGEGSRSGVKIVGGARK